MSRRGIEAVLTHLAKLPPAESLSFAELREQYDRAERVFPPPADVIVEVATAPIVRAEWLRPAAARRDAVVLYLHGGGYAIGSPRSHRHVAAAIAAAAGVTGLLLDYRRAPESPFPAAVDDAVAAYRWLLGRGISPEHIVVAGDSAGGGLTVATLIALRDAGVTLPAGGVCISPWTDLTRSAESYVTNLSDPIVKPALIVEMASAYLGGAKATSPLASPLYADLSGLPPLLIQVGSGELLLDDAKGLAARARAAGVDATLEVWEDMVHVWHWFLPMLDEAQAAIDRIGEFVRERIG